MKFIFVTHMRRLNPKRFKILAKNDRNGKMRIDQKFIRVQPTIKGCIYFAIYEM